MGDVVSLVRTNSSKENIKDSIKEALDLIDFKPEGSVKSVDIKANLCYYWPAATGYTTDPQVVGGIIDYVRERFGNDVKIRIVESDATAMRVKHAFVVLGYEKLAKEKNVELFNLSKDNIDEITIEVNKQKITFEVPKSLVNSDLFIGVPKPKILHETKISCALKNIFGCIASPKKIVYHKFLNEAIVGINKLLHPNLTVADGLIAFGRFPVRLGLVMASVDPFSVDWIASKIMGYNPRKIEFLKVAIKEKLGDPTGIRTCGESITTFKNIFPKENFFSSKRWWDMQFGLLTLYKKLVKDVVPPFLEKS